MIDILQAFVHQLLIYGGFRVEQFPKELYRALLTALESALNTREFILIPGLLDWVSQWPGYLIIDDTDNPKYGLTHWVVNLKNRTTKGVQPGYKVVLFLWVLEDGRRFPIGFGLSYKGGETCPDLAYNGLSQLRNRYSRKIRPLAVLADGAYSTDDITKLLEGYGWCLIMRSKKTRLLDGKQASKAIGRGYGALSGHLKNGVKVKMVRTRGQFVLCNRQKMEAHEIRRLYRLRWKIEEVFRGIKSCIGLNGCQQHSMLAQAVYLLLCFQLFACLEEASAGKIYYLWHQVNLGQIDLPTLLNQGFLAM